MKLVFIIAFLTLSFSINICAQITAKEANKIFADVPTDRRELLIERLNLFLNYEKQQQTEKAYDFIAEKFKQSIESGLDIESYKNGFSKTQSFKVIAGEISDNDTIVSIEGCGKFIGEKKKHTRLIIAYWENDTWTFSTAYILGLHKQTECK